MAIFGFGRRPAAEAQVRERVEAWARERLGPGDVVKVNEILCPDPACPGLETVILVMAPGRRTRAVKVGRPAAEVTQADVAQALVQAPAQAP